MSMSDSSGGGRGPRGVTMQMVGRLAGVSQVTVSRALSDPSKVSPATLERIQQAIRATGFVPNALAGALAGQRSRLISALVPSITNPVYSAMLATFAERMRLDGYQILLTETGLGLDEEAAALAAHLSRRPDAVLLTGVHHSRETRQMLLGAGVPVVELWDVTETPIDLCVGFSHAEAGAAQAEFAIAAGYRRAVLLSAADLRAQRRMQAVAAKFEAAGLPTPVTRICPSASLANGREMLAGLLAQGGLGGAVVCCSSDVLAHGALIEAQARGLSVPGDLGILGFGDFDFAASTEPGLTTLRVDRDEMGRRAAELLLQRIAGSPVETQVVRVGYAIVRRGSV